MSSSFQPGVNLIHRVAMVVGMVIFGIHVGDAIRARHVRGMVLESFKVSRLAKEHVTRNVVAGREPTDGWKRLDSDNIHVDIESRTGIITVTYLQSMAEVAGTTLVFFPLKAEENGQHHLQSQGGWSTPVEWTCTSSLSLMRYSPELRHQRGSLPSRYAPAECR